MPRISTHAIPLELVRRASRPMVDELVALLGVSREHFSIEVSEQPFVLDGEVVTSHPFVDVALFDRGAEAEHGVASIITRHLRAAGCESVDVYLTRLEKQRYYENGQHF